MAGIAYVGRAGEIRRGTARAAGLTAWRIVPSAEAPGDFDLTATLGMSSEYWLGQSPLDLTVEIGPKLLAWKGIALRALSATSITARLHGAPEQSNR